MNNSCVGVDVAGMPGQVEESKLSCSLFPGMMPDGLVCWYKRSGDLVVLYASPLIGQSHLAVVLPGPTQDQSAFFLIMNCDKYQGCLALGLCLC